MEEPTEADPRGHPQKVPRVPCRTANARTRVDALEVMPSCSVHMEISCIAVECLRLGFLRWSPRRQSSENSNEGRPKGIAVRPMHASGWMLWIF